MNLAKLLPCLLVVFGTVHGSSFAWCEGTEAMASMEPQWIWTPVQKSGRVPNGACFFRRTFDVARLPSNASIEIAADDSFEVYVNGHPAGSGDGWQHFTQLDIEDYLQLGTNVVAVKVVNLSRGHAGLAAQVRLGARHVVPTDASWRATLIPLRHWKQVRFADRGWRPAQELGPWEKTSPWITDTVAALPAGTTSEINTDEAEAAEAGMESPATLTASQLGEAADDGSRVVTASLEEALFGEKKDREPEPPSEQAESAEPKVLRPTQPEAADAPRFDPDRPRWSTDPRGGGPQQIRNPFLKERRSVTTNTDVAVPKTTEATRSDERVASAPLRPTPQADPSKVFTTRTPDVAVPEAPVEDTRFAPVAGFAVEEVLAADKTGSLVAASFNEFGQLIVSREKGPLLLCSDKNQDGQFDEIREYCDLVTNCQGILALSGMAFVIADGPEGTGLYRLNDKSRQGKLDQASLLVGFDVTALEHGPHGITLGPDGKLYITCGNHATIQGEFSQESPRKHLYEGDLVPRYEDPGGHANGVKVPAGFVLRTDTNGKQLELFASGLRNVYDLAFNADGELFGQDSDMESDMSTTWYRPTQVYHIRPGSEFGWRSGWAKWPTHFLDVTPPIATTGRGSPTGAIVYNHYAYPAAFRGALFLGDWSQGRILVAKPMPDGAGLKMETDTFLQGRPLNVTDLDVGPDGLLYFVTGGRGTEGGVFRVKWKGKPNQPPAASTLMQQALVSPQINSSWGRQRVAVIQQRMGETWGSSLIAATQNTTLPVEQRVQAMQLMQWVGPLPSASLLLRLSEDEEPRIRKFVANLLHSVAKDERVPLRLVEMLSDRDASVRRQACETLARANRSVPFQFLSPLLASQDRAEATAARLLLQLDHPDEWLESALASTEPRVFLQSATALMVAWPTEARARVVVEKSLTLMKGYLSDDDFVDLLRVLQLAVLRGELEPDSVKELQVALAQEFPANHRIMNREMIRLMVRLQVTSIKDRYLDHLDTDLPEEDRIHIATHLRFLEGPWTMKEKLRLFKHLKPSADAGGSVAGYLENVARDFSKDVDENDALVVLDQGSVVPGAALEAVMRLPNDLSKAQIQQLVRLDKKVTATDDLSKKLKVAILAVLARDGDDAAMAHLRAVYDNEPSRRVECTIGLAERPDGENWPYLVKSLSVVDGEIAREVIQKLLSVNQQPSTPDAYRQVILAGLRLGDEGGDDAVRLLERWRGFASTEDTPPWKDALRAWQNWFAKTYPNEPAAQLTQRKQREKWDYQKLVAHLGKTATLRSASVERGRHVFVQAQCAKCHRHGSLGESMGPNLTALSGRFHMREIVESILFPSKVISDQYKSKTLITDEGLSYTGLVGSGGPDALMVLQQDGQKVRVPTETVEQTVPSQMSSMPEGLLDGLTLEEVTDLVAFLQQAADTSTANRDTSSSQSVRTE